METKKEITVMSNDIISLQDKITDGIDINQLNEDDKTMLMLAIEDGREDIINFLIDNKVNLNFQNENGEDALVVAFQSGDNKIIELLELDEFSIFGMVY